MSHFMLPTLLRLNQHGSSILPPAQSDNRTKHMAATFFNLVHDSCKQMHSHATSLGGGCHMLCAIVRLLLSATAVD